MKHAFRLTGLAAAALLLAIAPAGAIKLENYQKYRLDSRSVPVNS